MNIERLFGTEVLQNMRQRLLPYDEKVSHNTERLDVDSIIEGYSPRQALDEYLEWNGISRWTDSIIDTWNRLATSTTVIISHPNGEQPFLTSTLLPMPCIMEVGTRLTTIVFSGCIDKYDINTWADENGINPEHYFVSYAHHGR